MYFVKVIYKIRRPLISGAMCIYRPTYVLPPGQTSAIDSCQTFDVILL